MGKRERNKGAGGELEVAKLLLAWWLPVEPRPRGKALRFVRVPSSGGWLHGPEFNACGDVMTNAERFPFSVEVKREERWSPVELFDGKRSPVWGWWRQCQDDAKKANREPMLWFRQNLKPWFVMLRQRYAQGVLISPPDVVWSRGLPRRVDCRVQPVIYMGRRVLEQDPRGFAVG